MKHLVFWLYLKPRWWAFLAWRAVGKRVFGLPHTLDFNSGQQIMAVMFSSSVETLHEIKTLWENKTHYLGLEKELKTAQDQIAELEGNIEQPEAKE